MELTQVFEAIMLICFGAAWPISIYKLYKAKAAQGKSRLFLCIVMLGYISGIGYKLCGTTDAIIALYILNLIMVFIDFLLCCKYKREYAQNPDKMTTVDNLGKGNR